MPDTSVKFLHSGMLGAPKVALYDSGVVTAATVAQNVFDVLNAVLVSGFNTQTAARISVSGGVATLYFDNTHGFEQDAVVKVSGAAVSSLNGEKRVATTPSGMTLTFDAAGVPDQQVLTGAAVKYAPLGWSLSGAPTTLPATFYSTDPTGTGVAFTARQYSTYAIYIDAYRGFSGGAPQQAFAASKLLPVSAPIGGSGGISYGAWVVAGDGKTLHLLWHSPSDTGITLPSAFNGVLSSLGDFESLAPVDAHRALYHATQGPHGASLDPYGVQYLNTADMSGHAWLAGSANVLVTPAVDAAVAGQLPDLSAHIEAVVSEAIRIRADFPLPSAVAEASYASHTDRPTVGQSTGGWQLARPTEFGITTSHQEVAALPVGPTNGWQAGRDLRGSVEHRLPSTLVAAPVRQSVKFQDAQSIHVPRDSAHQEANRTRQSSRTGFQDGARVLDSKLFKHQDGDRAKRNMARTGWQDAALRGSEYDTSFQRALAFVWQRRGRFQDARQPLVGISVPPKEVVPPPPYYEPTVDLVFGKVAKVDSFIPFRFVPEDDTSANTTIVPVQRVYIVLNNTALRRLSDNAVVPCTSMSLSLDVTSWTWGFDAFIPGNYQALVEPTSDGPVALAAWVNGTEFRVLAENVSRERSFGKVGLRVSGRGINAELDAPYAPIQTFRNTELRTSAQLLEDVLTVNGVPMGYAFGYAPAAWEVPAGAFNFQGTYIGALAAVAQAGGGYLKPHTRDRAFSVQQLYPIAPWEWSSAVPDFVLPSAVVTRESVQWKEMPSYNRVFVSGQDNGVLGQVTRAGTDGTVLAPMVVDALITSATAARQRGLSILGNTGRQLLHSLRLPVLTTTGVIQPGALVQYEDGGDVRVGMVRSTSVEVGYPDVYQTIGVECHA